MNGGLPLHSFCSIFTGFRSSRHVDMVEYGQRLLWIYSFDDEVLRKSVLLMRIFENDTL